MWPDRVTFMVENFNRITMDNRFLLVEVMNNLLKMMVDKEASDIEVGGYGSEDFIWFRIYGKKEPILELPKLSNDETSLLILSILNDRQQKLLEELRKLDFSYTLDYVNNVYAKKNGDFREIRFRGCAYFDVDRLAMNMRSIVLN